MMYSWPHLQPTQPMRSKLYDLLPDEGAGNLGVDKAVAHDQDVDECLPKGASVLHLPYSLVGNKEITFSLHVVGNQHSFYAHLVILPVKQRIKLSHLAFVNADLILPATEGSFWQPICYHIIHIIFMFLFYNVNQQCRLCLKHNSIVLFLCPCLLVVPKLPSHILCPAKKCISDF